MDKLIIIESPNKIKTLNKYLGKEYEIIATIGHIRDLSKFGMGFTKDFDPNWIVIKNNENGVDKNEIIKTLQQKAKQAKEIYIATDPDREGEAIAWHVFDILPKECQPKCKRITFNEITKNAIFNSFNFKRDIDMNYVNSQFARRIIDRLIGFRLTKLIRNKIKAASAGRVQSVTLKFIKEKEKLINSFVPEFWYTIDAFLEDGTQIFLKKINPNYKDILIADKKFSNNELNLKTHETATNLLKKLKNEFVITNIGQKAYTNSYPKSPYKTSTLQQDAYNKLGWSVKKTNLIAQNLYEGVLVDNSQIALISYPRTDSLRLSDIFIDHAKNYILDTYGQKYLNANFLNKTTINKDQKVQDAHEAIRPIDPNLNPNSLKNKMKKDEFLLYQLIYNRTIASLMSPAINSNITISFNNNDNIFELNHKKLEFDGYKKVYQYEPNEKNDEWKQYELNSVFKAKSLSVKDHKTTPPSRYNQASLIADLEKYGVGRPSTYSMMVNIVLDRGYVENVDKTFVINKMGELTINQLEEFFPDIININFTKEMENHLDNIAIGNEPWKAWIKDFAVKFDDDIKNAYLNMEKKVEIINDRICPKCNGQLIMKHSFKNKSNFIGCSNYPQCNYTESIKKDQPTVLDLKCPLCQSDLLIRKNRYHQEFIGCSAFPNCKCIIDLKLYQKYKEIKPDVQVISKEDLLQYLTKTKKGFVKNKLKKAI